MGSKNEAENNQAELEKGNRRIVATAANGLGWFVDFARRDLDQLSAGDALNLEYEFGALCAFGAPSRKAKGLHPMRECFKWELVGEGELKSAQDIARTVLKEALEGKVIVRALPPMTRYLFPRSSEPWADFVTTNDRLGQFTNALLDLLANRGMLLRVCPSADCPVGMFVADRLSQRFCSNTCKAREGMRKLRKGGKPHGKRK